MRHRILALSFATILGAAVAAPAGAQSAQKWSVQASGLSVGVQGEAYEGLSAGTGFEVQLRRTPGLWSFGGGLQMSNHDLKFDDGSKETVTLAGVFFEPRRVFDVGNANYAPYLSLRIAVLTQSIDVDVLGTSASASATGTQWNGGGGVLFRMSSRVNLDVGATYGLIQFGDVKVESGGQSGTVDGSSGTGRNLVFRLGVAVGLGK